MIGIIALLISILLPALGNAREQAKTIKCLSNMRQLGVAMAAYTAESKGYLCPPDQRDINDNTGGRSSTSGPRSWFPKAT